MAPKFRIANFHYIVGLIFANLVLLSTFSCAFGTNGTIESPTSKSDEDKTVSPTSQTLSSATSTTQTTISPTTTAAPSMTNSSEQPTTMREPSEQEINEARKIIHEIAATIKVDSNRVALNKPAQVQVQEYAPDSPEARVASATTQFGLNFINSLPDETRNSILISPVSLHVLLNIILLGTDSQSPTELELARVLDHKANDLVQAITTNNATDNSTKAADRSNPHAAMHSLLEGLSQATHLTIDDQSNQQQLLNSEPQLVAVLQTTARDVGMALTGQVNFTLSNLMLVNKDLVKIRNTYENDLKRYYDIKLEQFSKSSDKTSNDTKPLYERVNRWVQNVTQNQISELLSESDLSGDDLAMVLLNAAHFKGRWLHTFNTKLTQERLFYNEGRESGGQEVKFMRQNGIFGYAEFGPIGVQSVTGSTSTRSEHTVARLSKYDTIISEDSDVENETLPVVPLSPPALELSKEETKRLELTANLSCSVLMMPFALNDGQELSMVILLPTKRDGLGELMANLNGPALNEIYRSLSEQHVQVELPKFSFETSIDAKSALEKMGLTRIFQVGADFGQMLADGSPKNAAKVDKVVHKAKIAVDEMGAEAAAASAATIVLRNLIRPPNPSFVADHPFLFVIRHNRSNLPLFMGTIERL